MKRIYEFLQQLMIHNDREWFNANKHQYLEVQHLFNEFSLSLINGISAFDKSVGGLQLSDCTYRIYRDIRFSSDKSPYKTHMGVYVCPGGKKSWHSGYYLHIEPDGAGYLDRCMVVVGAYMPDTKALASIREDVFSRSDEFLSAVGVMKGFEFDHSRDMKKIPRGYPQDCPMAEYLKMRDFSMVAPIPEKYLFGSPETLLKYALRMFRPAVAYNAFLNRAIDSADDL